MADDIKIIIGVDATPVERAVRVMDNLEAEVRKVERAEKAGLITKERAKAETDRLTASMQKLKTVANGSVSDFNKFEKSLYGSGKAARRNEIALQQAGYQFQDFIVQVQAGTNPLIAFSQQGSQLAGFFAGPWGAAIGLGIAAVGALGTALMGAMGDVKSFEDQLKETTSSLEDYFSLLEESKEPFGDAFDKATEKLVKTSEAYKDLLAVAKIEAFDGINKLNESLTESVLSASYLKTEVQDVSNLLDKGFVATVSATLGGRAGKEIRSMYNALVQLREAPTLDAQYEAALKAREIFKQNVDVTGDLTDQQKQFWKELSTTIQKMELLGAATNTAKTAYDDILGSAEGLKEATEALNEIDADNIEKVKEATLKVEEGFRKVAEEQVKLFEAQGKHKEALELAAGLAYDEAKAKVLAKAETQEQRVLLAQAAEEAGQLAAEAVHVADNTRQAKEEAKAFAAALRQALAAMDALENFGTSIEKKLEVAKAKGVALAKGLDEQVLGQIAGERFTAFEKYSEAMLNATDVTQQNAALREYQTTLANINALEEQQLANAKKRKELKDAASAAKSAGKANVSPLVESLLTEQEKVDAWREESLAKLQNFNNLELEILGGHANAKLLIEKEYEEKVRALKVNKTQQTTSAISGILSGFAGLMDANNKKQFEAQKKFQIAAAVVDGYSAAVSAWDKGMKLGGPGLAAAFTAGSLLKTGGLIKQINSAQYGGGGGGVSGASAAVPTPSAPQPQRVIVEGLDRNSLYTGEQLSNIFEALYKENKDRGFVFEVAR